MARSRGIIAYLFFVFLFLGLYMSMLQRIVGEIARQYTLDNTAMGAIIIMTFAGFAVSPILTGEITDRYGRRIVMLIAFIAMLLGFSLTVAVAGPFGAGAGFFVSGMAFGMFEMTLSSLLTDIRPNAANRVMNNSRLFYALGTIAGPFLAMAFLSLTGSWLFVMVCDIALFFVLFVIFLALSYPLPKYPNCIAAKRDKSFITFELLKNRIVIVLCVSAMMYIAVEAGLTFYVSKYIGQINANELFSTLTLSVFWLFVALGRIVSGRIKQNLHMLVGVLAVIACAGLAVCMATDDLALSIMAFGVMGVGCSGIYPTLLAAAKLRFPSYAGTLFGIMLSVGAAGGIVLPYIMGAVADASGLKTALAGCLIPLALLIAAQVVLGISEKRRYAAAKNESENQSV